MPAACPFCAIADGRAPAAMVLEEDTVLAFMDLRQAVPGHVLVIPRRHVPDIHSLSADEAAAVMQAAVRVANALHAAVAPDGINLWQSNGEAAGQEVFHFHLHVHPRRVGDGLMRIYPEGRLPLADRAARDTLARALRSHLDR